MIIVAASTALSAWIMKDLVNSALARSEANSVLYFPLLVCGLFLVKGIFAYLQEVGVAKIGARIVAEVQERLYDHILHMDVGFFQRRSSGDLITRMSNGANAVRDALNLTAVTLGRDLLTVVGLSIVMLVQDPILFAIVITTAPIAVLMLRRLSAMAKKATKSEAGGMAEVVSLTRETSQGIRMLKSFRLEKLLKMRMSAATRAVEEQRNKLARVRAAVAPLSEILSGFAIAAVIFYGAWRSQTDPDSIGRLFSFITALLLAGEPLRRLSRLHVDLATASERIAMLYSILDMPALEAAGRDKPSLLVKEGQIVFDNVTFSYNKAKPVLNAVSLTCPGGKTTAILGVSGGGKTTLLGLLQGFFRPTKGSIRIDGTPIEAVLLTSLRDQIAYLDQEAFLFEGTIEDNIVGSCAVRDANRVAEAATLAGAEQFILSTKQGYQTRVQELGSNFSGGQKQRIAIARAFYKNAPILLLDEPTSALDHEAEVHIRDALKTLSRGRTTIVVSHRLSTVQDADMIYVLAGGEVRESGTHQQLMVRGGIYAVQYKSQGAGYEKMSVVKS
jgi:ATP-binding cassette subfamily B protein